MLHPAYPIDNSHNTLSPPHPSAIARYCPHRYLHDASLGWVNAGESWGQWHVMLNNAAHQQKKDDEQLSPLQLARIERDRRKGRAPAWRRTRAGYWQ